MQCSLGGLPGSVVSGSTIFDLTHVNDRAYYVPRGYVLEDKLYLWRVKTDRDAGRIFFVNCGGLGKSWDLPDVFADNYRRTMHDLHGCRRIFPSPPKSSSMTRSTSSHAIAVADLPTSDRNENTNAHIGTTRSTSMMPSPSYGSPPICTSSFKEAMSDIYANDINYLKMFDEAQPSASHGTTAHSSHLVAPTRPEIGDAASLLLATQLQRMIGDHAEEVSMLRQKLEEQERLCMEKDLTQVKLEERMVRMRVRMLEALSTYRHDVSYCGKNTSLGTDVK